MATNSQIDANRKNSKSSTGPTSEAGKATCSQNSLKHGLASSQLIIPGESEDEFNALLSMLLNHHQPENITETLLVQDMAKYHWLADRALRLQNEAISQTSGSLDKVLPVLAILIRYQTANQRGFEQSLTTLNTLRKIRLAEIGSASKTATRAAKEVADAQYAALKKRHAEAHEELMRLMQPMTDERMIADGYYRDPKTGTWAADKKVA